MKKIRLFEARTQRVDPGEVLDSSQNQAIDTGRARENPVKLIRDSAELLRSSTNPSVCVRESISDVRARETSDVKRAALSSLTMRWADENRLLQNAYPRLGWVLLEKQFILSSLVAIKTATGHDGLMILPSSVDHKWLENIHTHPDINLSWPDMLKLFSVYAGLGHPLAVRHYQSSCAALESRSSNDVLRQIDAPIHDNSVWTPLIAAQLSPAAAQSAIQVLAGSTNATVGQIAHTHNKSADQAAKIAQIQTKAGMLAGFENRAFLYVPGAQAHNPQLIEQGYGGAEMINTRTAQIEALNVKGSSKSVILPAHVESDLTGYLDALRAAALAVLVHKSVQRAYSSSLVGNETKPVTQFIRIEPNATQKFRASWSN